MFIIFFSYTYMKDNVCMVVLYSHRIKNCLTDFDNNFRLFLEISLCQKGSESQGRFNESKLFIVYQCYWFDWIKKKKILEHTYCYSALSWNASVVIETMNKVWWFCNLLKFIDEHPGICRSNGKVKLPV